MINKFKIICAIIIVSLTFFGCKKSIVTIETNNANGGKDIEIYLLKSFSTESHGQIVESTAMLSDTPLITYSDILSYNRSEYSFKLSPKAVSAINNIQHSVSGIAFAVTADKEIIYTGYFWPSYSSATCEWVVTDPVTVSGTNKMQIMLGYPGSIEWSTIPDKRNDSRILVILQKDKKLE
jgi:hypothetical protein